MDVFTTTPVPELASAGEQFAELEAAGLRRAPSPTRPATIPFLPLTLAADRTSTLRLGTAVAIAFARTPMLLATLAYDLQDVSAGRFVLGLGHPDPAPHRAAVLHALVTADGPAPRDGAGHPGHLGRLGRAPPRSTSGASSTPTP